MRAVREYAYAKINLHLDILSRREDGFHDIRTVMHTVSLSDELTISAIPAKEPFVSLTISGAEFLPADRRNIAVQAAYAFLERTALKYLVEIKLAKHIPIAAGLAGGSSDAAAVLRGLNKLLGRPLGKAALLDIGLSLGSDVPYCILGGTRLCLGRGEDMTALPSVQLNIVIAIADEHISAGAAYGELDKLYDNFSSGEILGQEKYRALAECLQRGEFEPNSLYNIFEDAVLPMCEGAAKIKTRLIELGASVALMSGSGPSVFGVFASYDEALAAAEALRHEGYFAEGAMSII